jgi:hypothetical protein
MRLDSGIVVETDKGLAILKDLPTAQITFRPDKDHSLEQLFVRRGSGRAVPRSEFLLQLEDFVEAAQTGRAPMVPGRHGMASVQLIEDLYRHRTALDAVPEPVAGGQR